MKEKIEIFKNDNTWQEVKINSFQALTIIFYKPICCITTRDDPQKRETIYDFLPKTYHHLKPAGRLDFMSEGLLILSSDGNLIQDITHPKNEHEKIYLVGLKKSLLQKYLLELKKGITLDNYLLNPVKVELIGIPKIPSQVRGGFKSNPENNAGNNAGNSIYKNIETETNQISEENQNEFKSLSYLNLNKDLFWYKFELTEGRNNQIRKVCEVYGQKVMRLIRIKQGDFRVSQKLWKEKILLV